MRLIRRPTGIARSLRGLAVRVHRRTEPLPRLPFGMAVGVAVLLLFLAIETTPGPDKAVTEVDELTMSMDEERFAADFSTVPAELEIVEFGFGKVVDWFGGERLSLGAIVRNPNEAVVMPSTLAVMGADGDGTPVVLERIYLDFIPPETSVPVGYVLLGRPDGVDEESLDLVVEEAQMWDSGEDGADAGLYGFDVETHRLAEIEVVDIEPLFSPEGYRITYRIEADEDLDPAATLKIALVFRDGDGTIVGGMPGWGDPFNGTGGNLGYRSIPPGVSLQYLDLSAASIPAGADLNRSEIGLGV